MLNDLRARIPASETCYYVTQTHTRADAHTHRHSHTHTHAHTKAMPHFLLEGIFVAPRRRRTFSSTANINNEGNYPSTNLHFLPPQQALLLIEKTPGDLTTTVCLRNKTRRRSILCAPRRRERRHNRSFTRPLTTR